MLNYESYMSGTLPIDSKSAPSTVKQLHVSHIGWNGIDIVDHSGNLTVGTNHAFRWNSGGKVLAAPVAKLIKNNDHPDPKYFVTTKVDTNGKDIHLKIFHLKVGAANAENSELKFEEIPIPDDAAIELVYVVGADE